jgi:hypothetical protein
VLEPEGQLPGCARTLLGLPLRGWDTVVIVLLTVVADLCLYTHGGGTGAAVLLLVAVIGLISAAPDGRANARPLLMAAVTLAAAACIWNAWWLLHVVAWAAVLGFAVALHRPDYRITELLWAGPWTVLLAPFRLFGHFVHNTLCLFKPAPEGAFLRLLGRFRLRIVIVPLVVCVLFLLIFMAANPAVDQIVSDISQVVGDWFRAVVDLFAWTRIATWVLWLLLFAALVRPLTKSWVADFLAERPEVLRPPRGPAKERGNFATALTTLICVNLLFLAFNVVDWVYLFDLPEGTSYAQHAHRGCTWLTLALALSTLVLGIVFKNRLNFHPRKGALRAWSYVWALQNGVLALGALRRLQMYVDYNGLTRLRIVGLVGVLLVLAGLVCMVRKVRRSKNMLWLIRRDLVALSVALVLLALTPRDWICWEYNVSRAMRGGNLRPLAGLTLDEEGRRRQPMSAESFPPLLRLLRYTDEDAARQEMVRQGIAGLLGRTLHRLSEAEPESWSEWQGSYAWALSRLTDARPRIREIAPDPDRWEVMENRLLGEAEKGVHTPSGRED